MDRKESYSVTFNNVVIIKSSICLKVDLAVLNKFFKFSLKKICKLSPVKEQKLVTLIEFLDDVEDTFQEEG